MHTRSIFLKYRLSPILPVSNSSTCRPSLHKMASRRTKKKPEAGGKSYLAYIVAALAILVALAVKFAPTGVPDAAGVSSSASAEKDAPPAELKIEGSKIPSIRAFDASGGVVAVAADDGPYDAALIIGYGVDKQFPATPALESRTLLAAQLYCAKMADNLILTGAPIDHSWENVSPAEQMRHFAEKLIAKYTKTEYVHDSYPKCALPGFGYVYPGPPPGASRDERGEHRRIRELTGNKGGCEHRARRHTCVGKKFTWVLEEAGVNAKESARFSFEEAKKRGWSKIVVVHSADQMDSAKAYAAVAEEMASTDPEFSMTIRIVETPT